MKKRKLMYPIPAMPSVQVLAALAHEGADARGWYREAWVEIELAAPKLGISSTRLADLLALFSPRVSVLRSVRWAIHYSRTGEFMHDATRSHRLAVKHYEQTKEIRGPKTAPFAKALMGDGSALVLDSWMSKALNVDHKRFEVRAVHDAASKRVRLTAMVLGWPVAETQAALWAATVRKHRVEVPRISIMAEIEA